MQNAITFACELIFVNNFMYSYGRFYYSKQCSRVKVLMKVAIQFDTLSAMEIQTIMHTQINAPKWLP